MHTHVTVIESSILIHNFFLNTPPHTPIDIPLVLNKGTSPHYNMEGPTRTTLPFMASLNIPIFYKLINE